MEKKVIVYIAVSEDGYIATPDGSVSWLDPFNGTGEDYEYYAFYDSIETVVMGNATYEQILTFGPWPYKEKKSYVFRHETTPLKEATALHGDVSKISMEGKRKWLVGGSNLIKQFAQAGLVDEYIITVMPVKLGSGIPLYLDEEVFALKETISYKKDVVQKRYEKSR